MLSARTKNFLRTAFGEFNNIEVSSWTQSYASYGDKVRLKANANFAHVEKWLCHIVMDWNNSRVNLARKFSFIASWRVDTSSIVDELYFYSSLKTIFSPSIGADIQDKCGRYNRAIKCDFQPIIATHEWSSAGTPCIGIINKLLSRLTNLWKGNKNMLLTRVGKFLI